MPPIPATAAPVLLIDGGGLVMRGTDGKRRVIAFGGPAADALAAARQFYGEPQTVEVLEECGAGPLQASRFSGLTLAAQDGQFAGWWVDASHKPPQPKTERGIGVGSTRAALAAAYSVEAFDSSLGDEFTADDFAGLTDGKGDGASVTHLWAGATCIMR